jgi:hypothetical protein
VTCTIHVVWGVSVSFIGDAYTVGRSPATHRKKGSRVQDSGERLYLGDNGAGASSNGGADNVDGGESIGLALKLLPVI